MNTCSTTLTPAQTLERWAAGWRPSPATTTTSTALQPRPHGAHSVHLRGWSLTNRPAASWIRETWWRAGYRAGQAAR